MLEPNSHESDLLLQRSKSYDARLNFVYDSTYYDNDSSSNQIQTKTITTEQKDNSNQTQIIVTSFAPDPRTKNLIRTTIQTRPISQQYVIKNVDNINLTQAIKVQDSSQDYKRKLNVMWQDGKNSPPLIVFSAKVLRKTCWECKKIGEQFRMSYKFQHGEKKLVKAILDGHGFKEAHPNSSEFNIIWTGNNLKSYAFRSLQENQKVNHFPRSCELTRKDRLYKNVQKMQKDKGSKVFNILPVTFVMPFEIDDFYTTFYREKGIWIVKPTSLSRGRGIYLISHPDQIPLEDNLVVSKYISNPLLIEGFKFDLRLYVAVTSFDPLVFYLYEEGLTRFATIKYDQNLRNIKNICMHLTNYSLNKKNDKYVRCHDPEIEDYGNKWTMSALLRYLSAQGKDTFGLMMHIEEAIIKTLVAVESPLASAARMFVPSRTNCFELFGFDILIDEEMKPWVLEVNLSPSLDCDALLDIRVKSNMLADLFTLTGIYCTNPNSFSTRSRTRDKVNTKSENKLRVRPHSAGLVTNNQKPNSTTNINNNSNTNTTKTTNTTTNNTTNNIIYTNNIQTNNLNYMNSNNNDENNKSGDPLYDGLNQTETEILKTAINEDSRTESWIRLFPTSDTWEFYSQYLENRSTSYNMMIHKRLFPRRWQLGSTIKKATQSRARLLQNMNATYRDSFNLYNSTEISGASLNDALDRYKKYERKLNDTVKPCEETLKRLSTQPSFQLNTQNSVPTPSLKSNFTVFPNGDLKTKNTSLSSNEEESLENAVEVNRISKSVFPPAPNYYVKKQLPSLSAMIKSNRRRYYSDDEFGEGSQHESDDENHRSSNKPVEIKYDLESVLKHLENGYYISRIQVRNAFALYLFKIHVRLVTESQNKDDSNIQQMDLVLRFIRKAAPNLSQEFKVYVPSKRLPLSEQKRMLAKQLHDFLHIYRKDTGQIRIDMGSQLDQERKKFRNKLIDEKAFQSLLYKCCEAELEEIMSVYMKNSQDSTVFLGSCKSNENTNEVINFNLTPSVNSSSVQESTATITPTKPKSAAPSFTTNFQTDRPMIKPVSSFNSKSKTLLLNKIPSDKKPKRPEITKEVSVKIDSNNKAKAKKINNSGDELSGLSCDSHSGFSNSSDSEKDENEPVNLQSRSYSRSLSRSTSVSSKRNDSENRKKRIRESKSAVSRYHYQKTSSPNQKETQQISPNLKNQTDGLKALKLNERSKTTVNNNTNNNNSNKKFDYETIITNIYLNNSHNKFTKVTNRKKTNYNIRPITALNKTNTASGTIFNEKSNDIPFKRANNYQQLLGITLSPNSTISPLLQTKDSSSINQKNFYIQKHENNLNNKTDESNHPILSNGLKHLTMRKQERVYSAAKSAFRIASSLNLNDYSQDELTQSNDQKSDTKLIDHLERQKEQTNRLLQKSKAKHNEMISMSLIQN